MVEIIECAKTWHKKNSCQIPFCQKKNQQYKIHVWLFQQPVMYLPTTVTFPVLMLSPFWLAATHVYRPASTMLTPTIFRYPLDNNWAPFWFPSVIGRLSFPPFFSQLIVGTGAASGMQGIVRLPLFAARIVLGRGFLAKDGLNATKTNRILSMWNSNLVEKFLTSGWLFNNPMLGLMYFFHVKKNAYIQYIMY